MGFHQVGVAIIIDRSIESDRLGMVIKMLQILRKGVVMITLVGVLVFSSSSTTAI